MRLLNFRSAAILLAASASLAGCAYNPYGGASVGVGYGDPYYGGYSDRYGYNRSGYGSYGYDRYGYGGYGYSPYYGWNNGYYYPGSGYYVYDRNRNPFYWSDAQRRYWEARRYRDQNRTEVQANWSDFIRGRVVDVNDIRVTRADGTQVNSTRQVSGQRVQSDRSEARRQAIREAGERRRAEAAAQPTEERRNWRRRPQD